MPNFDYEKDTAIDPEDLFEESIKLSSMFFQYSKALSTAKADTKRIWEKLKVRRAELTLEYKRANPSATGPLIEAHYRTHPDHIEAKEMLIQAEYDEALIQDSIASFYRKEKGLEQAVSMAKMEWWSGPKETYDADGGKRIFEAIKTGKANERRTKTATRIRKRP
jgi:hypothetical protein